MQPGTIMARRLASAHGLAKDYGDETTTYERPRPPRKPDAG